MNIRDEHIAAGLGLLGAGLLGGGIYSGIKAHLAVKEFEKNLKNWRQFGSQTLSKHLQRRLQTKLGTTVPIVTLSGHKAREYGVQDNAFFAPPPYSTQLREELKLPPIKTGEKDPGVILAGKKTALPPILAHELGHAKSYKEGKQPSALVNALISGGGALTGFIGARIASEAFRSPTAPLLALTAPMALSAWWLAHRTNKEENRASTSALEALATLKNRKKYLENDKKLLDTAYDTYKYGGRYQWMIPAAVAAGAGALGVLANRYKY